MGRPVPWHTTRVLPHPDYVHGILIFLGQDINGCSNQEILELFFGNSED